MYAAGSSGDRGSQPLLADGHQFEGLAAPEPPLLARRHQFEGLAAPEPPLLARRHQFEGLAAPEPRFSGLSPPFAPVC